MLCNVFFQSSQMTDEMGFQFANFSARMDVGGCEGGPSIEAEAGKEQAGFKSKSLNGV